MKHMANNLLVISHSYANFIKTPVEQVASSFDEISVLVRINPIADISRIIPVDYLKPFSSTSKINLANKPPNIKVIPTPIFYLPTSSGYKNLLGRHFSAVDNILHKNATRYNLIHAHFVITAGYTGALLKKKYDKPLIVTAHGEDIYDVPFRDEDWKEKVEFVLNTADRIITVSNKNVDYMKKLKIKKPVAVIPNGFSGDLFYPMDRDESVKKLNLPTDKKIILSIGSLLDVKGHEYLIKAISELIKYRNDVLCIIIGDGDQKNRLKKMVKDYGLNKYIKILGGKSHSEIPLWINACDIFVLPSINEGNPTVMFECLGCGKPFVGTRVGGVPEIIVSDDYGFVVEPKNIEQLAEKIYEGLCKEWNRRKIISYAEQFTWETLSNKIKEIYDSVVQLNLDPGRAVG